MGCGSSSMKGEKPEDVQDSAPKPLKKVATNFASVNYETPGTGRRNTEYAPHDIEAHKPSEALSPLTEKTADPIAQQGASTQPQATAPATVEDRLSAGQSTQDPLGADVAAPKEPYHDVTASPSSPTAPNVTAAFPESHDTKQAQ